MEGQHDDAAIVDAFDVAETVSPFAVAVALLNWAADGYDAVVDGAIQYATPVVHAEDEVAVSDGSLGVVVAAVVVVDVEGAFVADAVVAIVVDGDLEGRAALLVEYFGLALAHVTSDRLVVAG